MKKFQLLILALLITVSVNAQSLTLLKDIRSGSSSSNPEFFYRASENKIYFFAINPATTLRSLYFSDGTTSGTILLLDDVSTVFNDFNIFDSDNFLSFNGNLCFRARVGNAQNYQLWFTDGTPQGTYALTNFSVSTSIFSITELNNQIYFYATSTSSDGIYKSNLSSIDAIKIINLSTNQRGSRLVKNGLKIYRIARFEIYEISNDAESLIFNSNSCISQNAVINNKLVFNKRSCSTSDPVYQSTEAFNFTSYTTTTLSSDIQLGGFGGDIKGGYITWLNKNYSASLKPKSISGSGSKTDILYIVTTNGVSIQKQSLYYIDSCEIDFNGFYEFDNKYYFSITFTPTFAQNPTHKITRFYEVGNLNNTLIFEFVDVISNYKIRANRFTILNNKVLFIADTNALVTERSNLCISSGVETFSFSPVFFSSNPNISLDVKDLCRLNNQNILVSASVNNSSPILGNELYLFSLLPSNIDEVFDKRIAIFPNPANEYLQISSDYNIEQIAIYDLMGRLVLVSINKTINIQNLEKGVYLIRINNKLNNYVHRFIKE